MVDHSTCLSVQAQLNLKKLFTVAEVEEVKYISMIIPSSLSLVGYSIVDSIGNTLFFNQAKEINSDFSVIRLYIIGKVTSYCASVLWSNPSAKLLNLKIVVGTICSVLCILSSRMVEIYREHVFEQDHVTISIWWLTPQFIFLGLAEGLLKDGIEGLFKKRVSESMDIAGTNLVQVTIGLGRLLSFWFVLKGSGIDDNNRLGRYYYIFLGATSVGNVPISGLLYIYLKDVLTNTPSSTISTPQPSPPRPPKTPPQPPKKPDCTCTKKGKTKCNCPPPKGCKGSPRTPPKMCCTRPLEEAQCGCPSPIECGGFRNGGTTEEIYAAYNCHCCPPSGIQDPQPILDSHPPVPYWSCIPHSEGNSSIFPPCTCGGHCNNNPPVTCTPWIVIDDCTPGTGRYFHSWAL